MSLLRVCGIAKCLNRRSLFETCAVRASLADCSQLCMSRRGGAVRRISETPSRLQTKKATFVLDRFEGGHKRVQKQSDVLDARICKSDAAVDVQNAKVHLVKPPSCGIDIMFVKNHKVTAIPKSKKTESPTPGLTRWMEKLSDEKKKSKEKSTLIKKMITKVKSKSGKKNSMLTIWSRKTILSTAQKTVSGAQDNAKQLAKGDTPDWWLSPNENKRMSSGSPEHLQEASEGPEGFTKTSESNFMLPGKSRKTISVTPQETNEQAQEESPNHLEETSEGPARGTVQRGISSYLEACLFAGDIERAHRFLLRQHRLRGRRKHLNTDVYNIMMRVWAKRATLNMIGRVFILLEEAGLKPNLGSYCAALECMGRNPNHPNVIKRCLDRMQEDGVSVDDLFNQCVFRKDERDMVLKAVNVVQPFYQPKNTSSQCSSPLVQDFYLQRENHQYPKLDFTKEDLQERFKQQLSLEQACSVTIDSVEAAKPVTENIARMRELLAGQRAQWEKVLLKTLKERKAALAKTNSSDSRINLYPYLCLLRNKEYVQIMIKSITYIPPNGESLMNLAKDLGHRVFTIYAVRQKQRSKVVDKLAIIYNDYTEHLAKNTKENRVLPREQWRKLEEEQSSGPSLHGDVDNWPFTVTLDLGTYLLDIMVKNLRINSDILNPENTRRVIPILYHMYTFRSIKKICFIKPHPILSQMLLEAMETKLTFDSYVMPMLCPPMPWSSAKFGAYLLTPTKLMRTLDGATQHDVLLNSVNLDPVLDSLNQLGNCAWQINKPILDIIISFFNDRGSEKLDIPPPMSEAPQMPHYNPQDQTLTGSQKAQMMRELIKAKKKCSEMHSLRMSALYKLSIANHVRDEIFWFPHNMDFRGRTYPCPPHFNHLGSDVTRSLLMFAEGKPLGPKGLDWLKIHLVNLTGLKKRSSIQGRLDYANSIMEDILDSADNPLNGKKWWMNADEFWQALACCMEIAKAVRSPDPTKYISHFPVHQDGSCNGLQHYAALGRDVIGATSVNLAPCELPQDVYSGVAQQVEEFRAQDAARGIGIAKDLKGFISRKVVKQTVMTLVYGVTRYGGRLQIEKRLNEIDEFPKEKVWEASHYLVRLVFSSLNEMFTGTREIQDWLTESAQLISKSGHTVEWVTPLGLPIIQPYHRPCNEQMKGTVRNFSVQNSHDIHQRPNTMKQKNAFPPNFIHSLDSTHMMLTALQCSSAGLVFVSVHDCFWTHALTVETMNKICREQFVNLHSQPILRELSDFLINKYCPPSRIDSTNKKHREYQKLMTLLANVPQTGDFDLEQVKESTYFFS